MRRLLLSTAVVGTLWSACGSDPPALPTVPAVDAGLPEVPKARALGQLEAPTGEVTLERAKEKRAAKTEPLFAGDMIETGADSSAVLRFAGDRVVELGPDGRFEISSDGSGLQLNVLDGLVLTRIKATPAQEDGDVLVTINTPFGLTRIGGAELALKVQDGATDVEVKLGEIELVTKTGEVTKVGAGKKGYLGKVREMPEIPLSIVVSGSNGKAELKARDAKSFVAINPKKPPQLKSGDTVRVKDGRFSLAPEGSATRVSLLKGAEVGIVEARKGGGGDATALDVKKGNLEVAAPSGQTTRLGVAPGVTLVSDLGGQFTLRRTGSGFDVDALAGDVLIEREGEANVTIPGGQSATVPLKGTAAVRESTREQVVLPARGVKLFHSGLKRISVQWDEEGAKEWRFQLASEPGFANPARDGVLHDPFISIPALPKGAWFWRVFKGNQAVGDEHAKGQVFFGPEPRSADLSRLQNVVKAGDEKLTAIHFQDKDKPPVVTFTWDKDEGAAKYTLRVYRDGQLSSTVAERTVGERLVSLPENTLAEGKYVWSVTPLDGKGEALKGGRMNKLEMRFDNGVASLLIKTPRNGDAGGRAVSTSGVAPVGSKLFINGRAIELDAQARFDTSVAPLPGGRIVYRLVSGGGESWTVRTVRSK